MIDKIKKIFLTDEEYEYSGVTEGQELHETPKPIKLSKLKVSESEVVISEPLSYSESQSIADYVKANRSIIINLHRVTPDQAKRIIDFMSGTVYAIDGNIQKIGEEIFFITPSSVNVTGTSEESALEII